jgi:rRNA maturation protein Nop10
MNDIIKSKKSERAAKLTAEAVALFNCKEKFVPSILFALGLRETCSRCGGSGRYSWCQMYGDTCFKCGGKGEFAAPLTTKVLELARPKIEAGELVALRAVWAAKNAAKASLAPKLAEAEAIYMVIGNAYTEGSKTKRGSTAAEITAHTHAFVQSPLYFAQGMNNSIYFDFMCHSFDAVKSGRRTDYIELSAQFDEAIEMLRTLRDAYLAQAA